MNVGGEMEVASQTITAGTTQTTLNEDPAVASQSGGVLPPPPFSDMHSLGDGADEKQSETGPSVCPGTPTQSSSSSRYDVILHPNTPTPHAVASPSSPDGPDGNLIEDRSRTNYTSMNANDTEDTNNEPKQEPKANHTTDPGPYAAPFLSVIIDPRFSGPHTLVALRALHRLLSRGSIVQLCSHKTPRSFPFYTCLQPIALRVMACRFEQTDAGADEAVEMAIADLLGLIIQFDGEGVRSLEKSVLERAKEKKRTGNRGHQYPQQQPPQSGNAKMRIPRLPAAVIMEAFHAVFVTRQTFVRGGVHMGHYSPALSNHFEQVLVNMIHCVFGGDDSLNARQIRELSSRNVVAASAVMRFLVDQILRVTLREEEADERALCLRLIQCCIKTGWGMSDTLFEQDKELLRIVEDDLCLALLTTGQAIWTEDGSQGVVTTSPEVLSEVCSTLSLLWSLDHLRKKLHSQFVAIFSGFYQRALSLLRKRPLPEDGIAFQSNIVFDSEVEVILESLVDILCLHSGSLSTLEELFGTYDCSLTELDVASGLLIELSLCCGGCVDEDGEAMPYSAPMNKASSSDAQTPQKNDGLKEHMTNRFRPVPDYLKELCSQAVLGCIKQLRRSTNQMSTTQVGVGGNKNTIAPNNSLRTTKEKKQVLHHAAKLFNNKPSKGIQYLLDKGVLPNPVTPKSVSSFLRNGLVVGLDKVAVGQYLGEKGKTPDKNPAVWESESFHKEVLASFCSSFAFKNQSLLDGLRMFLATFRLPGEAQMIDRILQGFSESCGCSCEESVNGSLKLFSKDEKRASDAAYLLSFSIIMLNTDLVRIPSYCTLRYFLSFIYLLCFFAQHNDNIRADRKMKVNDFVKNNTNYGKEISDSDLPREYLEKLYNNIKTNQIRTLGEGADGSMTIERWKDVMRGASVQSTGDDLCAASDLKELLLESSWQPLFSTISGLWAMNGAVAFEDDGFELIETGRIQKARLGIELAFELLSGASGRPDIFQDLFSHICLMTGLLGEYNTGPDERSYEFMQSVERQSALIVAVKVCLEYGDVVGLDGWKFIWGICLELRDLQLLPARNNPTLLSESEVDLLSPDARQMFSLRITKGDDYEDEDSRQSGGLFGALFRVASSSDNIQNQIQDSALTVHCKDVQLLWDEFEEDTGNDAGSQESDSFVSRNQSSIGVAFQNRFAAENASGEHDMPVTGLERMDNEGTDGGLSLRARVRDRLATLVDFYGLVSESRFMDTNLGLSDSINALIEIIHDASKQANIIAQEGSEVDDSFFGLPLSPASEALAEILLCEITLKNRDRFAVIWETILSAHYNHRLSIGSDDSSKTIKLTPGIEKCVTSVLRMCNFVTSRNIPIASEVLATLNVLHPPLGCLFWSPLELNLDKHLSEGVWRICQNVDGLSQVNARGWEGILGLLEWCASRGGLPNPQQPILIDDDPSLQAFRSLHLLLHANELNDSVPPSIVTPIRCLVEAGERANSTRLSIAGLELLQVLHLRLERSWGDEKVRNQSLSEAESKTLARQWLPILEAIAEPAEKSRNSVR